MGVAVLDCCPQRGPRAEEVGLADELVESAWAGAHGQWSTVGLVIAGALTSVHVSGRIFGRLAAGIFVEQGIHCI